MIRPKPTNPTIAKNRTQSVLRRAMDLQLPNQLLEHPSAVFVVLKLIEARARGRKQNNVSPGRALVRMLDRSFKRPYVYKRSHPLQLPFDNRSSRANQQHALRFLLQRIGQRRVVAALVFTP